VPLLALSFTLLKIKNNNFCQNALFLSTSLQIFLKNKKKTPQVILFGKFDKQKDS
jgi:hypothetical protein